MKKITILLLSLFISSNIIAQEINPKLIGLDEEIEELIRAYKTVGVSVAIVKDDSIIYSRGFGYRDLKQGLKMSANTSLPIGSITKSFTSSLIGLLEKNNNNLISEKPSFYIPKLQFFNDKMDLLITIEDLLSHRSGLGVMDASSAFFPVNNFSEFIPRFRYLQPTGEVKNSFQYSNVGYGILGHVIESQSGISWEKNIIQKLFTPLKMLNSYPTVEQMQKSDDYSVGYGRHANTELEVPFHKFTFIKPGGSLCSSAHDMGNYIISWMNSGLFENKQILPENYVKNALEIQNILPQNQASSEDFLFGYGYGWFVRSSKGKYLIEHGGGTSGFTSLLSMFPNEKLGIITLTNQHNSGLPYYIKDIIINRIFDYPRKKVVEYPVSISDIYQIPQETATNGNNKPTNKWSDFEGIYLDKGHGEILIKNVEGKLFAHFPTYVFRLDHLQRNTFIMQGTTDNSQFFNPNFTVNFHIDADGNVSSLNINFHPDLVEFKKTK